MTIPTIRMSFIVSISFIMIFYYYGYKYMDNFWINNTLGDYIKCLVFGVFIQPFIKWYNDIVVNI